MTSFAVKSCLNRSFKKKFIRTRSAAHSLRSQVKMESESDCSLRQLSRFGLYNRDWNKETKNNAEKTQNSVRRLLPVHHCHIAHVSAFWSDTDIPFACERHGSQLTKLWTHFDENIGRIGLGTRKQSYNLLNLCITRSTFTYTCLTLTPRCPLIRCGINRYSHHYSRPTVLYCQWGKPL